MNFIEPARLFRTKSLDARQAELRAGVEIARRVGPDAEQRARMRAALSLPPEPPRPPTDAGSASAAAESGVFVLRSWTLRRSLVAAFAVALTSLAVWSGHRSPAPTAPAAREAAQAKVLPQPTAPVQSQALDRQPSAADTLSAQPAPGLGGEPRVAAVARNPLAGQRQVRRSAPTTRVRSEPAPSVDLERELQLLKRARARVRSQPSGALALIALHEREFADGTFVEEREVLAIDALLALGDRSRAQRRAARFFIQHPNSAHVRRVEALIGAKPKLSQPTATP